jgi:hypothetical protein
MATPPEKIFPQQPVTPVAGIHTKGLHDNALAQSVNTSINQIIDYLGDNLNNPAGFTNPGYFEIGGLIIQWLTGPTDPADNSEPTHALTWPKPFPNALLTVQLSTGIAAASITCDLVYQFFGADVNGLSIQRQFMSTGSSNNQTTKAYILGIGN